MGLFGGSFDPVHQGHFHLSNIAIKTLKLKQIWWLVSSQNPLKKKYQEHTVMKRLKEIKEKNKNYKVIPMALEYHLKTKYSYDTIRILKKRFPQVNFFLIVGADNLLILHKWYNWEKLFYMCPIVVFDRPDYFYKSISSKAAIYFLKNRTAIKKLICKRKNSLPKWSYVKNKLDYNSSSLIRKNKS
ncbi:nicotinate (nicotinamide) nucleotide adenylyltransferase [Alphaproteobacteria bacterium]|nr:nicotinate (nicotinamide) nucleotide adenylyltransferase [Alphaproteobacteria bacterium]